MTLRNPKVRACVAACVRPLLAAAALAACATWTPIGQGTPATLPAALPAEVRVVLKGEQSLLLRAAQVAGDSLVGTHIRVAGDRQGPRVAIPLASVARVEEHRPDGLATGRVLLLVLLLAGLFYLVAPRGS